MDILRIATAGSVDDGKSTLIGRLLYETRSVTQDRLEALDAASRRRGLGFRDLSLLTDGLIAEREQGITIDVAHVYFHTARRKYIIADTPGHFEYTRNMVTGASKAQVSIILIDARNGLVEQTHRHYFIAAMMRIPEVIVCVNKMDLVGYSQAQFDEIAAGFTRAAQRIRPAGQKITFVPMSSLLGENVVSGSKNMAWYAGPTALELLEACETHHDASLPARLQAQSVIRPRATALHDYRAIAGRIASGSFAVGDEVVALPGNQTSRITGITRAGVAVQSASAGASVAAQLENDIDTPRGTMLAKPAQSPSAKKETRAQVCWFDERPMNPAGMYVLQHGAHRIKAKGLGVHHVVDVVTLAQTPNPPHLRLNEIGEASFKLSAPLMADPFARNPANGAFILIDEWTNNTVGVGLVVD